MNGATTFISKGLDIAFSRGIVCVTSAGNEGNLAWHYISAPADAVNSLTVGAVKSNKTYATFSSVGPSFDGRVKPDVTAQGDKPYVVSDAAGNITNSGSGTSYSCPIIAGMVACLWQALPSKTNQEIKQLIIEASDRYAAPTPQFGYGIPDFNKALSSGNTLSITDFSKNDFIIYPNPTTDLVSVTFPEGTDKGNVIFYSISGQKALEEKITKESSVISIKSLSKGTYLYTIESNGFSKNGKIIKQ
jgi:subtilisin family serine protease